MALHRVEPGLRGLPQVMDPIGFALENFDAVGAWRTREPSGAVDASGQLADGTDVVGVVVAAQARCSPARTSSCDDDREADDLCAGTRIDVPDMPAVRRVVRDAATQDYRSRRSCSES